MAASGNTFDANNANKNGAFAEEDVEDLDHVGDFLDNFTDQEWGRLDSILDGIPIPNLPGESNIPGLAQSVQVPAYEQLPTQLATDLAQYPDPDAQRFPVYADPSSFKLPQVQNYQNFNGPQNLDPRLMGQAADRPTFPGSVGGFNSYEQMNMARQAAMNSGFPGYQVPYPTGYVPQAVHSRKRPADAYSDLDATSREDKRRRYSTSASEEDDPRQLYGYRKPANPIPTWGSRDQFKYSSEGELKASNSNRNAMSLADMNEFFFSQPAHRKQPITLYVGRQPFACNARFSNAPIYRGCRFEGCLEKSAKGCSGGTVEKGNFVLVADEFGGTIDPFKLPRWHLWCIERYLDFPKMVMELDVRMEDRDVFAIGAKMDKQAAGMSLMSRASTNGSAGTAQYECGLAFLKALRKTGMCPAVPNKLVADVDGASDKARALQPFFGTYPSHAQRGNPRHANLLSACEEDVAHGPYFGTLGHRMALVKLTKDAALLRHAETRPKASDAKSRFRDHLYDLAKSTPGRQMTRRLSQQLSHKSKGRKTMLDLEEEEEEEVVAPKRTGRQTRQKVVASNDDDDEWDPSGYQGY